jgi:hypothetical protein
MKRYNLINNALGWLCFIIAAVTYLLTIEPTASFWDCPEFILQAFKLEVGHPPGNPIFMLAGRFFITLFGGDITSAAVAVNVMSALLSAATILLLFWTITHLIRRLVVKDDATEIPLSKMLVIMGGGLCGALAYTWSDTFWFSAVEGEVYAFSSFCTALVFWLILKWEARADEPHSDRYLVLIAYVIGVSIAVHLLNLLCIPAIGLVYYYRKFKNISATGSLIALGVSCVIVGLILYGLVPGFINVAQWFELFFVNTLGFGYNIGVTVYAAVAVTVFILATRSLYLQRSTSSVKWLFFATIIISGMPFIGDSWLIPTVFIIGLAVYLFGFCSKLPVRVFNVIVLGIFVIFIGYSSYALLLIRANANPPMNQNAPDNVFALASYLNREQYGDRPLFYGPVFTEELAYEDINGTYIVRVDEQGFPRTRVIDGYLRDGEGRAYNDPTRTYTKVVKTRPGQPDRYVEEVERPGYKAMPDIKMLFTRIYSSDTRSGHPEAYKSWADYTTPDIYDIPAQVRQQWAKDGYAYLSDIAPYMTHQQVITTAVSPDGSPVNHTSAWKPGFDVNLRYFLNYQLNHMYWRYFMWNFAGRQNDIQGNGEPHLGNWISGIPLIDNARLGDQSLLPDEFGKGNKGHNVFYMLPLLLGVIGLLWQALCNSERGIEQFWVIFFLFFMTGIAIVLYLNQTPGQPRERDYAFAGSFYAFSIWIGIGVPAVASLIGMLFRKKKSEAPAEAPEDPADRRLPLAAAIPAVLVGLFVPLQMVSQTWDDHDRSGRYTTRDLGMNYLASVGDNGIIFTNGDNDTFPLWYAQEVEGFRTDVRVVNLSYLTTDWYAHNLTYPYYEAAPVKTYATPKDYAYERLAYNFIIPMSDSTVTAETALRSLYASDAKRIGAPFMTYSDIVIPAAGYGRPDSLASDGSVIYPALDDTTSAEYRDLMPSFGDIRLDLSSQGQGASQSKILSLDIIANSMAAGGRRPVYFASTVPSSYYLGLDPYMYSAGMALEVTPFNNAPYSPNADTAYENFMSKFRWGGLDDPEKAASLYLDETVRRMVSSTRSAIIECVDNLMIKGLRPASEWAVEFARTNGQPVPATHYDMARNLLRLLEEKLPADAALYDGLQSYYMASDYLALYDATGDTADLDRAEAILNREIPRMAQLVRYGSSLSRSQLNSIGRSETVAMQYLGLMTGLKNAVAVFRALDGRDDRDDLLKDFPEGLAVSYAQNIYPMIYLDGYTIDELRTGMQHSSGALAKVYETAARLLELHQAAGVDPMGVTDSIVAANGLDIDAWRNLVN